MSEVMNIAPKDGLRESLGIRGRLILHPGLTNPNFGKGPQPLHGGDVHRGNAQIHYISANPKCNGRIILDIQEPHSREIGELLVDDAIVIRTTLGRRCEFVVVCTTPDPPTTMRAVPL